MPITLVSQQFEGPLSAVSGTTAQFSLIATYSDGSTVDLSATVSWAVSDNTVATISPLGLVTCYRPGQITVSESTIGDITRSSVLVITPAPLVSIAVTAPQSSLLLATQEQLTAIGTYADGSTANLTQVCAWSSNAATLSVSSAGIAKALRAPGTAASPRLLAALLSPTATASFAGITASLLIPLQQASTQGVVNPTLPVYRSHRTQQLLNYFDAADQRVRFEPYTLDAQLLNTAAIVLDDSQQRIARELAASTLSTCPSGIDNRGLYYKIQLPNTFVLAAGQTLLNSVTGFKAGLPPTVITPYDDRLPVPRSFVQDPARSAVPLTNPQLFDVTGSGDATVGVWDVQSLGPFALAVPNTLSFWVDGVQGAAMALDIFVEGDEYPLPVWADQQQGASETISASQEGSIASILIWKNISSITVRGLPAGVRLRCWQMPFNLPAVADPARPYTHPVFRDQLFDRYWAISSSNLLEEQYMMDNYSTLEYIQSYASGVALAGVALEPNTWGILGASGTSLLYWDRREPLPGQLNVTAATVEPLYGVSVRYNVVKSSEGAERWIAIHPIPYRGSAQMAKWRYILEDPAGSFSAINPDGSLTAYTGGAGWQTVPPTPVSVPLALTGTYVITMECMGSNNAVLADSAPYPNFAIPSPTTYDLSSLGSAIEGVAFDVFGQIWVWTGTSMVPIKPRYDAYILDPTSSAIYLTDSYDSVQYE